MYSARWTTIFAAALVGSGLALAQTTMPPARPRIVTVQDASGKPPLQCRVLRSWAEPDGTALEVESITTGERFTLVESGRIVTRPTGQRANTKVVQEVRSRIYRWSHNVPPPGAPLPPDATSATLLPTTPMTMPAPTVLPAPPQVAAQAPPPAIVTPVPPSTARPTMTPASTSQVVVQPVPPAGVPAPASTAAAPMPSAPVPPAAALTGSPATDKEAAAKPAKPSDWHISWGKADDHKSAAPEESHMPVREDLPQAKSDPSDPINDPQPYSPYLIKNRDGADDILGMKKADDEAKKKDADVAKADEKKADEKKDAHKDDSKSAGVKKEDHARDDKKVAARKEPEHKSNLGDRVKRFLGLSDMVKPASQTEEATGDRSIQAAQEAAGMRPPMAPALPASVTAAGDVDLTNAFTVVKPREKPKQEPASPDMLNAFTREGQTTPNQTMQPPTGMAPPGMPPTPYGMVPPTMPRMVPPAPPMYGYAQQPGMMPPMPPNPYRPATAPVQYGYPQQQPGMAPMYGYPQQPAPGMAPQMQYPAERGAIIPAAGKASASSGPDVPQLLLVLRSSLYPSHREWAADQLGSVEWRSNPAIVEVLVQSARNDPAASVREACVRNLGRMNANTPVVLDTLSGLEKDDNPRVRDEASRTLARFQVNSPAPAMRSVIQPAGLR